MTPIAIVGMGCRFAGAEDLRAYWEMTLQGRDAFGPPPADRWDHDAFFSTSKRATDKSYAPHGAFIQDIRSFPALAFGLPPRRVEVMDPQHRLTLEVALQAIEDAGYRAADLPYRTGVFVGVTASEYRTLMASRVIAQLMAGGALGEAPGDASTVVAGVNRVVPSRPFTAPGALQNMTAATVAQELDLHGPAYTTDAACASAMVALADAVAHLRAGSIDAALAGGVYLCVTPEHHIAFSRIGAMSASGYCRPFDARADGFVQGDGGGLLLLKRLDDALRDGDRVYAVIHGVATNNDGRGDGPMAPLSQGQAEVIRAAWRDAGLDPAQIGYIETHGTGTDVGDLTELTGLRQAFGDRIGEVALGSSKANVGHTMSAAAVAGVIRAALAIHHGTLPPMAGYDSSKPDFELQDGPIRVPKTAEAWRAERRFAGVSSFGFGGTNGHAVLGGANQDPDLLAQTELVVFSAPDEPTLRTHAAELAAAIEADPAASPAGVARALGVRKPQPARAALVVDSREALLAGLRAIAEGGRPESGHVGIAEGEAPKIAFLYPGQGAQRVGMLAALRDRFPVVAAALHRFEDALRGDLDFPLTHLLWPERRVTPVDEDTASAQLTATERCQPALLACGLALTELLAKVGVRPHVTLGHSLGEFTAAAAAGVWTGETAAAWVARRGRAMAALPGDHGAMAAIMADEATVDRLLVPGAVLANVNHPRQLVISGETAAVVEVVRRAEAADIKAVRLEVSHGFHSPVLAQLDADALLEGMTLASPAVPVASGILDHPYLNGEDARDAFRAHATAPVQFVRGLEQCRSLGADLYLQVGAGGPLAAFARGALPRDHRGVVSLAGVDDHDGGRSLLDGLARLWVAGVNLHTAPICGPALVPTLPPARYARESYWAVKEEVQLGLDVSAPATPRTPGRAPAVAPQPVAAAPQTDVDPVADGVFTVVAKVSAFPRATLRAGMTLVDDLGFDSLMVNDLATGLADTFPGLPGIPQELLINRPTIADLIQFVRTSRGEGGPAKVDDDAPLTLYAPAWRDTPLPAFRESALPKSARVKFVRDELGLAAALGFLGPDAGDGAADLLVYVAPFDAPVGVGAALSGEAAWPDLAGALAAALDHQARLGAKPDVIVLRRADDAFSAGLTGLALAAAREWPDAQVKSLSFAETPATSEAVDVLLREWRSTDRSVDVRYAGGQRFVRGFAPAEAAPSAPITAADTLLISGGTRGIGAKLAARLATTGARVVLLGRGKPEAGAAALIASNPRVQAIELDVTDAESARAALGGLGATHFIHAAGVLADGALGEVAPEAGALARRVKVAGWLNVLAACPSLRAAVAVGSWAGRLGNRHQAHYAAANAELAAVAASPMRSLRGAVVEFGPWTDSEMVRTIPTPIQATMRAEGVDFVGDRAGLDAILAALTSGSGVLTAGRALPWTTRRVTLSEILSVATHPFLADHAIEGRPVLPMAAVAERFAQAAALAPPFVVEDLRLFAGVVVDAPTPMQVRLDGDRAELRVGEAGRLAWRGRVRPLVGEPPADPGPLQGGEASSLTVEAFYRDVTFHGPLLAGLVGIDGVGPDFVRGRVRSGRPADWIPGTNLSRWAVDPLALDSLMQLAATVAYTRFGRAGTPVGLGRLVQLAPLPEGELRAEVRFSALTDDSDRFEGELLLRDRDGRPLLFVEGAVAELRKVPGVEPALQIKPEWVDPSKWPAVRDLEMRLEGATLLGISNPYFRVHQGTARNTTVVDGRELVNYSSYNYLGLSGDPRVLAAVHEAVDRYGTSVSASRVASGERPFHGQLESLLAQCQGADDALVFTAGHATNVTTIGHLMGPEDLVLHDELIHDSALQGIKLSGAARRAFKHDDPENLAKQLGELRKHYQKVLIVVEGVYSMDGDVCALPAYIALKKKYGCMLMVDEAHSFGIIGATGQGAREHFGIDGREVDIWMGTLSKSIASCGGWIAGSATLIRYLRYTAPGFVYSAGLTAANGVAALRSLELMLEEPWRVRKLQANAALFREALVSRGMDTGPAKGESAVVPVITGNSMHALVLSQRLVEQGINVQPIVYPAVADDAARLRFFLSSTHTDEQLLWTAERVAETLTAVRAEFRLR